MLPFLPGLAAGLLVQHVARSSLRNSAPLRDSCVFVVDGHGTVVPPARDQPDNASPTKGATTEAKHEPVRAPGSDRSVKRDLYVQPKPGDSVAPEGMEERTHLVVWGADGLTQKPPSRIHALKPRHRGRVTDKLTAPAATAATAAATATSTVRTILASIGAYAARVQSPHGVDWQLFEGLHCAAENMRHPLSWMTGRGAILMDPRNPAYDVAIRRIPGVVGDDLKLGKTLSYANAKQIKNALDGVEGVRVMVPRGDIAAHHARHPSSNIGQNLHESPVGRDRIAETRNALRDVGSRVTGNVVRDALRQAHKVGKNGGLIAMVIDSPIQFVAYAHSKKDLKSALGHIARCGVVGYCGAAAGSLAAAAVAASAAVISPLGFIVIAVSAAITASLIVGAVLDAIGRRFVGRAAKATIGKVIDALDASPAGSTVRKAASKAADAVASAVKALTSVVKNAWRNVSGWSRRHGGAAVA